MRKCLLLGWVLTIVACGTPTNELIALTPQPDSVVVENDFAISDHDRFTITGRLSNDGGRTREPLSRWEYRRARCPKG